MPLTRLARTLVFGLVVSAVLFVGGVGVVLADGEPPIPTVTLTGGGDVLIGESTSVTVSFTNISPNPDGVGYGPFVDVILPVNGADGATGTMVPDGLFYLSATFMETELTPTVLVFDELGQAVHPLTGETVVGIPGDQLVVFELPFGSYVPDQPNSDVAIQAMLSELADLDTTLYVRARAGFYLGADPLANPAADAPIVSEWTSPGLAVDPTIMTIHKAYIGPEDETATGPSWVRQYRVTVDIADGQPVSALQLSDVLPAEIAYVALESASPAGYSIVSEPPVAVPATSPTSTLALTWDIVTGTVSASDVTAVFSFFVPEFDANGDVILDPLSGGCQTVSNQAVAQGLWNPVDDRDDPVELTRESEEHEADFEACALVIQKHVSIVNDISAEGATPGDTLGYTFDIQSSDYFTVGGSVSYVVTDTLSDGQLFEFGGVSGADATFSFSDRDGTATGVFTDGIDMTVDTSLNPLYGTGGTCGGGQTILTFDIGAVLVAEGLTQRDALLTGGCIGQSGDPSVDPAYPAPAAAAQGTIVYRTVIQERYACPVPSGDQSVDHNDRLSNAVDIVGGVFKGTPSEKTGLTGDDSSASVRIVDGAICKSVYARNGVIGDTGPFEAGDSITYRISYCTPTADVEDVRLIDYLPLPTLRVDDWDADNVGGDASSWVFDATVLTDTIPAAGHAAYGPNDTFHSVVGGNPSPAPAPVLSAGVSSNSLVFYYGHHDVDGGAAVTKDLLFTLVLQDDPFADGMYLTNQLQVSEQNSFLDVSTSTDIVQIQLLGPSLDLHKGVVWASHGTISPEPAAPVSMNGAPCPVFSADITSAGLEATPVDSNASDLDAGDTVRFAIVIENLGTGPSGVFDVQLTDTLPTGITAAHVTNFCVTDGTGALLDYVELGDGLFDPAGGIELVDAAGAGSLGAFTVDGGSNIAVITYDVTIPVSATVDSIYQNTASLTNYANVEGGEDYIAKYGEISDDASWETTDPAVSKLLLATSESHSSGNNLVIGEIATYQVEIVVPEGTVPNAILVDTLEAGLALVDVLSVVVSPTVGTDYAGGWAGVAADAEFLNVGTGDANIDRQLSLPLGTLINTDVDDDTVELITVEYRVVMLNVASNVRGVSRENSAVLQWSTGSDSAAPVSVVVVEPQMSIAKAMTPASPDAGDEVLVTLTVSNPSASSQVDAYDVALADSVPAGLTFSSFASQSGLAPDVLDQTAGEITASWSLFPLNATSSIAFTATVDSTVAAGQTIRNDVDITWASKLDDIQAGDNPLGVRRTGNPSDVGGSANDYAVTDYDTVTIPASLTKTLVATSEAETPTNAVAVGEIIRYRLVAAVPEGETPDFVVRDRLPSGLLFLDDSTATGAMIADSGMTSSVVDGLGLLGVYTTGSSVVTPTVILADSMVSSSLTDTGVDIYASGADVYFHLGTVVNADRDADSEYVVFEFNALVLNISAVQDGVALSNTGRLYVDGSVVATSGSVGVVIVEPSLDIQKSLLTAAPYDAGDELIYEIVVTNVSAVGSGRIAHEIVVTDTIDTDTTLVSAVMNTGSAVIDMGSYVQSSETELAPGEVLTLTVTVSVNTDVAPETSLGDTASVTWTSLAGSGAVSDPTGSVVPGDSGESDGERDGSGGVNDHATSDDLAVDVEGVTAIKTLVGTSLVDSLGNDVAIGEVAEFQIRLAVPEGETSVITATDAVPNGLWVDVSTAQVALGSSIIAADTEISGGGSSGSDLSVVLTDLTVAANNLPDDNVIIITYQAYVVDEPGNVGQTSSAQTELTNGVSVQVGATTPVDAGSVSLTVIEPRLEIVKTMTPDPVAIGDTVVVTVTASNTGLASAYDVEVVDVLDGTYLDDWTVASVSSDASASLVPVGNSLLVTLEKAELAVGAEMSFVLTATVQAGVPYLTVIQNSATVSQATTLPGDNGLEREEPEVSASADITVGRPDIAVTKTDGVTEVSPGDTLAYVLSVSNVGEVRATGVVVTDTLPALSTYVGGSASDGGLYDSASDQLVWTIALLQPGQGVSLTYDVLMDTYVPESATNITNTVRAVDDGTRGEDPDLENNDDQDVDTIDATAVAEVIKEALITGPVAPGDTISYSVTVSNTGDRQAEMTFADGLDDPDLSLVAGSVATTQGTIVSGNSTGDAVIQVDLGTVTPGAPITITFDCLVSDPLQKTQARVVNQSVVTGENIEQVVSDDPTTPAVNDPTIVPIVAAPVLDISKTDALAVDNNGDGLANPGEGFVYTIVVTNTGNMPALDVQISDDLVGADVAYLPGSWTLSQGTADESDLTTPVFDIGQIDAGDVVTLTFGVQIDNPLPAGTESVANQAVATASNATNEPSDDPDTPADDDPTVTPVVTTPSMVSTKSAELLLDSDSSSTVSPGDTLRYTVIVTSTGDVDLSGMVITDTLDTHLTLVVGSVTSNWGTVTLGNGLGDTSVEVTAPLFRSQGLPVIVTFDALIVNPLPEGVDTVSNQAVVQSDELSDLPTDDPETVPEGDPTVTPVDAGPNIVVLKDDGVVSAVPGETITYTLTIDNVGNQVAALTLTDDVSDPNLTLVVGTVTTTQGVIVAGNSAGDTSVEVALGDVSPVGDTIIVTFQALVANPVSGGAESVVNQALALGDGIEAISDDPETPAIDDETVTPLVAAPLIDSLKSAGLLDDRDANGVVSPGDALQYVIVTENTGNASAMALTLEDTPDSHATLITGTVTTTMGTVITGNAVLDTSIVVSVPELAGGQAFTVTYNVMVEYPLAEAITLTNQGVIDWLGAPSPVLTDDPDTGEIDDPTLVSVDVTPVLDLIKTDDLLLDINNDGALNPGETLVYTLTLSNLGYQTATNVVLSDTLVSGVMLVTGSVTSTSGTVIEGNGAGDTSVLIEVGDLPGQASVVASFQVTLPLDWPLAVVQVVNQAMVASDVGDPLVSDDPDTSDADDPTVTPVVAVPEIVGFKADSLLVDEAQDGAISAGDTLRYTITVQNSGTGLASAVIFTDTLDPNTSLIVGSVTSALGTVDTGNAAGDTSVAVVLGDLEPGVVVTITYDAQIALELAPGTVLSNQGVISGPDFGSELTDDPSGSGDDDPTETEIVPPTFVDLTMFDVVGVTGSSVSLRWTTGAEVDNQRFEIWRASSLSFSTASSVGTVYAQVSAPDGATYNWTDTSVPDGAWWYWIVDYDSENNRTVHYGFTRMAVVGGGTYLPIVIR